MKTVFSVIIAVFVFLAFTCISMAATIKKNVENQENAKQGITKIDKTTKDKSGQAVDKTHGKNIGVEKPENAKQGITKEDKAKLNKAKTGSAVKTNDLK